MRDLGSHASRCKRSVQSRLNEFIGSYGYGALEVPVLEATELFLRKSGGALASQMYSFTDPGSNSVSLRPEFTSAIMRHYLETTSGAATDSVKRWQYAGPVFRYDPDNVASNGQFTQVGAELIGSHSTLADAELLSLAAGMPAALGIADYRVRVADLDVLDGVLDTVGLSDRARSFIVANMNRISSNQSTMSATLQRAAELHIASGRDVLPEENDLADAVSGLPDDEARHVLAGFMRWNGASGVPIGQRSSDEIVDRLLRKLRGGDDPDTVERGLTLAARLAAVNGDPADAIPQARSIVVSAGGDTSAIDRLTDLVNLVDDEPALKGHLQIDFSLARGIAYYNGIIFDIVRGVGATNLGGGGRYDSLSRALGGPHTVPALGFAFTLESLLEVMPADDPAIVRPQPVIVAPAGSDEYGTAMRAAREVRAQGGVAILDVSGKGNPGGNASDSAVVRELASEGRSQ